MHEGVTPPDPASEPSETPETSDTPDTQPSGGPIGEDWLATIVGLILVVLALTGVIGKGLIP